MDLKPKSNRKRTLTKGRSTLKVKFEEQYKDLIAVGKVSRPNYDSVPMQISKQLKERRRNCFKAKQEEL